MRRNGGKANAIVLGIVGLVVLLGAGAGLAYFGIIPVPDALAARLGISKEDPGGEEEIPSDEQDGAADSTLAGGANSEDEPELRAAAFQDDAPPSVMGEAADNSARRLAKVWDEVRAAELAAILADWTDENAAPVVARMDPTKTAKLLESLPPERASRLSAAIRREITRSEANRLSAAP